PYFVRESAGRIGASRPADALTEDEYDRTLLETDPALGAAVLAGSSDFTRARAAHRARLETNVLTPYDGALGGAAAEALESHPRTTGPMSPSSLETYALCPLKFFLGRVLGLEAVEEPEEIESIDPMNRGSLVHRVLERFLEQLGRTGTPPAESRRAEQLSRLEEIAREECADAERRGITGYPLLWRYERQAILDDLRAWYEHEMADPEAGRYGHGAYEVRFGPSRHGPDTSLLSSDEPVRIQTAGGRELLVQGRMDRVDYSERTGAYRVIDYKTGSVRKEHRSGKLAGGRALQLPLYLLAGAERTGSEPARGEAQYFFVSRYGNFRRVTFTNEDYEARREELERILSSFSEGMRTGNFHARPGDHCRWCDFDSLCDARRHTILDRKREDPRVREMDEIGEIP
ncbi:MAG: PD-(D/E)XK nuclease family protein, partial [Thermoleophilaceae bacterium]|nr:PD-(D/E)XK nuclease family protein [Thermoleophilaceae bacterium]